MRPPDSPASLPCELFQKVEGPLDLLLDEARRQNVGIENIAMAPIVARFLAYIGTAASRNLNLDIDWLHMAATLIHWKSQFLLPREPLERCEPDPIRDRLVRQLLVHRRQAAEELERRQSVTQDRFSRPVSVVLAEEAYEQRQGLSVWDMVQQARELAGWVVKHREEQRQWQELGVEQDDVTVSEMMDYLRTQLPTGKHESVDAVKLLREQSTTSRRACLFLGMLEMAREQTLELDQNEVFGPVRLSVR
jgi:chromatin segregation and condensation protein Rec8/ScpA/Scc1 (kleisin family)